MDVIIAGVQIVQRPDAITFTVQALTLILPRDVKPGLSITNGTKMEV